SVKAVMDPNPMPPGLHQYSVIVSTAHREMKFTAPTKERHDIWFNALSYLLSRQNGQPGQSTGDRTPLTSASANQQRPPLPSEEPRSAGYTPRSPRMGQSAITVDSMGTPRGARSVSRMSNPYGSVGKRNGTAAAEYMRWTGDAPASPSKMEDRTSGDFHIHEHDDAYDGLENVRACCDGKHD
ncbi:12344_t:CDS:2, partial [Acaulospora colombiana]